MTPERRAEIEQLLAVEGVRYLSVDFVRDLLDENRELRETIACPNPVAHVEVRPSRDRAAHIRGVIAEKHGTMRIGPTGQIGAGGRDRVVDDGSRVIYEVQGVYAIAENGVWIPGRYATQEAAEVAFGIDDAKLQELQNRVNARETDYHARVITLEMLRELQP